MDNKTRRARMREAQSINVTLQVGKDGITETLIQELNAQLERRKLVKVRLLPSATSGGSENASQAEALEQACDGELVEVRGHTAVYCKARH